MIWATLALLGIPIWFIAVVLIAAFKNRNAVRSNPNEFACRLKKGDGWRRKKGCARWERLLPLLRFEGTYRVENTSVSRPPCDMALNGTL